MKLLVIRPQPGADATAARVRAAAFDPLVMPLFAIEPVAWDAPDASAYDALLLTSGNAVRMAGPQFMALRNLPAYAVGIQSAAALKDAGISAIATGSSGIDEVLCIADRNSDQRVLWLAGEDRTDARLPAQISLDVRTVYRSAAILEPPGFAGNVAAARAVLLHSARAARHFSDVLSARAIDRGGVTLAVLSPKIAKAAGDGWRAVVIAPEPNDSSLLSALQRRFTTPSCDP